MEKSKIKKILIILAFVVFVLLMAYLIWITFFKSGPKIDPSQIASGTGSGLPSSTDGSAQLPIDGGSGENPELPGLSDGQSEPQAPYPDFINQVNPIAVGGVTQTDLLISDSVLEQTLSQDGNSIQYYNQKDGKFYIVDENGNTIPLSDRVFHNVEKVEWAPNKTKAVIEYPDSSKIVYNFATEKQYTLPSHWEDFSFSPDSNKLVNKSLDRDEDNRWLIISNSDGSQSRAIEHIGNNDDYVISSWSPNNQSVAMYTEGVNFDTREVFFIGQNEENFKSIKIDGWGFDGQWSKAGDKLLYNVYTPNNKLRPQLWIVNAQGNNIGSSRINLNLQTWSSKCAFADPSTIYCAVPIFLPEGAGMYPEMADNTPDNLYKINALNGSKELVAIPNGAYNVSSLSISANQANLFFTDKTTGRLYKIRLK